jgi:hypothetical protein
VWTCQVAQNTRAMIYHQQGKNPKLHHQRKDVGTKKKKKKKVTAKKEKNWVSAETGLNINMNGRHKKEEGWFVLSEAAKTIGLLKNRRVKSQNWGVDIEQRNPLSS